MKSGAEEWKGSELEAEDLVSDSGSITYQRCSFIHFPNLYVIIQKIHRGNILPHCLVWKTYTKTVLIWNKNDF